MSRSLKQRIIANLCTLNLKGADDKMCNETCAMVDELYAMVSIHEDIELTNEHLVKTLKKNLKEIEDYVEELSELKKKRKVEEK